MIILTAKGKKCLVIDGRQQLGGNVYCEDRNGVTVHRYGVHIFRPENQEIWEYVRRHAKFAAYKDGYIPLGGYNTLIENLLVGITAVTGVGYQHLAEVCPDIADKVVYTGAIDGFFAYSLGHLEYDSLKIEWEEWDQEYFQDEAIVIPEESIEGYEGCARVVEYKHFLGEKSGKTVVAFESLQEWIPGRLSCRPVGGEKNEKLLARYQEMAKEYPNVMFGGRLGSYTDYTRSKAISAALELAEKELEQP